MENEIASSEIGTMRDIIQNKVNELYPTSSQAIPNSVGALKQIVCKNL